MRFNHRTSFFLSAGLFVLLFFCGSLLSQHKLLWIDECYSQHVSVDKPSYLDILTLNFPDGNKNPLFYIFQKATCNLFSFHYPISHSEGSYDVADAWCQWVIRVPCNLCMSLALAALFYYFVRFFSLFAAIYALAVSLVSPMVWMYWAEARPYALWFMLTTAQLLLFCSTVHYPKIKVNKFINCIHVLLVLTTPGSIFQVSIIAIMLWWKKVYRHIELIWAWALPAGIFLLYYFLVPIYRVKTYFFFQNLYDVVMPEHFYIYAIYLWAVWAYARKELKSSGNAFFFPIFLLFLASAVLTLFKLLFTQDSQFGFFSRYLIYMVPADTIMFSLASYDLWQWTRKNLLIRINLSICLIGMLIVRGLMTYREVLSTALYLHSSG